MNTRMTPKDPTKASAQSSNLRTLELARIYESQGHFQDAHDIYEYLDSQDSTPETAASLSRLKTRLAKLKSRRGFSYPDLIIDTDLIEGGREMSDQMAEVTGLNAEHSSQDGRTPLEQLMDQWLALTVMEKQLKGLMQI